MDAEGRAHRGHEAVGQALKAMGVPWRMLGELVGRQPLRPLAAWTYGVVSRVRHRLPSGPPVCR